MTQEPNLVPDRDTALTIREQFMESMVDGNSAATTAQRLGIPAATAGVWARRLRKLASDLRNLQGVRPREIWSRPLLTGITLVHSADLLEASPGQTVTFTAWVMNDTNETLSEISLIQRSFTNAGMETLHYLTEPTPSARCHRSLMAGETTSWTFTYEVTEKDLSHGGDLVSAMGIQATSPASVNLWDECDAAVFLRPRQAEPIART